MKTSREKMLAEGWHRCIAANLKPSYKSPPEPGGVVVKITSKAVSNKRRWHASKLIETIQKPLLIGIAALFIASGASAQVYEFRPGEARAVDGDTLRIGSQRIRLAAMDAPELGQTCQSENGTMTLCGRDARDALARLIRNGVRCVVETKDRGSVANFVLGRGEGR